MNGDDPCWQRVNEHWEPGIDADELYDLVFPKEEYPKCHTRPKRGGQRLCYRPFNLVLKKVNLEIDKETNQVIRNYE